MRFERTEDESEQQASVTVVRVALVVNAGSVAVGCLNVAQTQFVDEVVAGPAPVSSTVELLVSKPAETGPLVIRNASASGASDARILEIQCCALDVSLDAAREPAISDPHPLARWSRYYGTATDTGLEKLRARHFEALTEPSIVRWTDGLSVRILPHDQLSRAVFVSGTYEPNTLVVLRGLLETGDTFVDAGANAGVLSLVASRWVGPEGRVYSFEPSDREYQRLVDNLDRNGAANVTPVRMALSSACGHAKLRVAPPGYGGLNTLGDRFPYEGIETCRLEPVELTTLDNFIDDHRVLRVAAVKLDVEGAEEAALLGATRLLRDQRPAIVAEVFSPSLQANGSSPAAVERLLRDAAYRLFLIDDATARLEPIGRLADIDGQNIVALPDERMDSILQSLGAGVPTLMTHELTGGRADGESLEENHSSFIERIVSSRVWGDSDLCLVDVGASGGIDPKWSIFGDHLTAVGFDPLVAEVDRLNRVEARHKIRYEAASVICRDYDALFPPAVRDDQIASRFNQPFLRSSAVAAHRILQLDYVREMFNSGARVEYSERTVTLDEFFASAQLRPDFLKIDTDGSDFQVLLGAANLLAGGNLLGVEIEVQFHGAVHDYASTFSNIDRFLRERGFTLFGLERYTYSRAALPAPFAIGVPAQTTTGQVHWGEAVYFRDLAHAHYGQMFHVTPTRGQLLKLCCLFELYGLSDCAAELLSVSEELKTLPGRVALLDALTPPLFGDVRHDDYIARFNRDPSRWLPQNLTADTRPQSSTSPVESEIRPVPKESPSPDAVRTENEHLHATVALMEARANRLREKISQLRRRLQERDDRLKKLKARHGPKGEER